MLKAFKYRLSLTPEQAVSLNGMLGSTRFVFNLALETKIHAYTKGVSVSCFELMKQVTDLKKEARWLNDCPSQSLQHAISHLDNAFSNFFKGRADFPKFKSKRNKQSVHLPSGIQVDWKQGLVFLPKLKWIKLIVGRAFAGTIRSATVSKTPTGKYFISILTETGDAIPAKQAIHKHTAVGIDVGLKHFATLSDGSKIDNPKFLFHSLQRLRVEQRTLKRRLKKSVNRGAGPEQTQGYQQQKLVVAKLHERVANQRKDFQHKASTAIVKQFDTVVLEDLAVKNMVKNRHLSRAIADVGWAGFTSMVRYKCEWYGKNFVQIGRFEPSSRICSQCGHHKGDLKLSEREWTCVKCTTTHDRDFNAATNIRNLGLSKILRVGPYPLVANVTHSGVCVG